MANRVRELIESGRVAIGAHAKVPATATVEIAAAAGLDFVRFDPYHWPYDHETLAAMTRAAVAKGITPWVRCSVDADTIRQMLELGIRGFTFPCVSTRAQAESIVAAVDQFVSASGVERREILVGCAIENKSGLESFEAILGLDGVDIMSTGPSDLAFALGETDNTKPIVQEAYARILETAIAANKHVYLSTRASRN
ncbi:aldolase/citrate lyase family protein, partial [Aminobacter niigataensis]